MRRMGMNIQKRGDKFQLRVTHRQLPKPFFLTHHDEAMLNGFGMALMQKLDKGEVPADALASLDTGGADPLFSAVIGAYANAVPLASSDEELVQVMRDEVGAVRMRGVNFNWVDKYVSRLKVDRHLAPGTIRKRVGSLARVMDWHLKMTLKEGEQLPVNPFRMLPTSYSQYSTQEAETLAKKGRAPRKDIARNRRLAPDEEHRIRLALSGVKRVDRERPLAVDPALQMMFDLIIDTGLRLKEAYTLRVDQVDFERSALHVEGTKGHRGALKPRVVPLKPELKKKLKVWCRDRNGLLFPFWDGDSASLRRTSSKLSVRFMTLFAYANVKDLTEHDLRHEATCRWFQLKYPKGGWVFSETEICKIMGWSTTTMALRYASFRVEDLTKRLG